MQECNTHPSRLARAHSASKTTMVAVYPSPMHSNFPRLPRPKIPCPYSLCRQSLGAREGWRGMRQGMRAITNPFGRAHFLSTNVTFCSSPDRSSDQRFYDITAQGTREVGTEFPKILLFGCIGGWSRRSAVKVFTLPLQVP